MKNKVTLEEAIQTMKSGKFFTVTFIKRTNNEERKLNGRCGVKKYIKKVGKPYKDKDHNLLTVFDVQIKQYRTVPLENLITINHKEIKQ